MSHLLRLLLLAWQYFTRIPLPARLAAWAGHDPAQLAASVALLPLIGGIVGAWGALVCALAWQALPSVPASAWVGALLATAATVWMTGALHEDGLADVADGLGAPVDRERALAIMKDSRVGSFAVLALVLAIGTKLALLAALAQAAGVAAAWALVAGHAVSRCAPLWLMRVLPNVGALAASKSRALAGIGWMGVGVGLACAALWLALAAAMAPDLPWGAGLLGAAGAAVWTWHLLHRRLHGYTGDGLGAAQQLAELGFYLGLACGGAAG